MKNFYRVGFPEHGAMQWTSFFNCNEDIVQVAWSITDRWHLGKYARGTWHTPPWTGTVKAHMLRERGPWRQRLSLFLLWFLFIFLTLKLLIYLFWPQFGILVPGWGIKPALPAAEVQSLNHWTAREAPLLWFLIWSLIPGYWELNLYVSLHLDCVTLTESLGLGGPDFVRCKTKLSIMRAVRVKRSMYMKPPLHCQVKSQKLRVLLLILMYPTRMS